MTEILAVAASIIAVSSLAIQLCDDIHKLQSYLQTVRDPPKSLSSTILDLRSLRALLLAADETSIKGKYSKANFNLIYRTLKDLEQITNELSQSQHKGSDSQLRKRIRWPIPESSFRRSQNSLKQCINTLTLALSCQTLDSDQIERGPIYIKSQISSIDHDLVFDDALGVLQRTKHVCEDLHQTLNRSFRSSDPFRLVKLEIQQLLQGLRNLKMLLESKPLAVIPSTDYVSALNITGEALTPLVAIFSAQKISSDEKRVLTWWSKPEIQREAKKCLANLQRARAALIAAQLAVTSRYESSEKSAVAAIVKNLNLLPFQMSREIRSTFGDQVDAAMIGIEDTRAPSRTIITCFSTLICKFSACRYKNPLNRENRFDGRYGNQTYFTVLPATWLQSLFPCQISVCTRTDTSGRSVAFLAQSILPSHARIFTALQNFDIEDIRGEFSKGSAHLNSIDCCGRGLMDIALDEIIRASQNENYLSKRALSNLNMRSTCLQFLASIGCRFDDTARLLVQVASETAPGTHKPWDERLGVLPGWLLIKLIEIDLEIVWEIQETWVSTIELRPDWWYYAYLERSSWMWAFDSKAKLSAVNLPNAGEGAVEMTSEISMGRPLNVVECSGVGSDLPSGYSLRPVSGNTIQREIFYSIELPEFSTQSTENSAFPRQEATTGDLQEDKPNCETNSYDESSEFSDDEPTTVSSTKNLSFKGGGQNVSTVATSVSDLDRPTIATDEFIELLQEQSPLNDYINIAPKITDALHFQGQLCSFLSVYGVALIDKAVDPREEAAGQLIVLQSQFIAAVLGRRIFPKDVVKQLEMESLENGAVMTMDERLSRLWKSLEAIEPGIMDTMPENPMTDFEENLNLPFLTTIRDLQGFLFSGEAFDKFQDQVKAFVSYDEKVNDGSDYFIICLFLRLLTKATRLFMLIYTTLVLIIRLIHVLRRPPIPPGHRRLEWKCECGDELYADFDNSNPNDIKSLKEHLDNLWVPQNDKDNIAQPQLRDIPSLPLTHGDSNKEYALQDIIVGVASITTPSPNRVVSASSLPPSDTQANTESSPSTYNTSCSTNSTEISPQSTRTTTSQTNFMRPLPGDPSRIPIQHATSSSIDALNGIPVYLEICVKHKKYTSRHKEMQIDMAEDDYHFFQRVKNAYLEIRRPRWINFLKPLRVEHVQFSVQNMGEVVGIFHHDGPRIPLQEEVEDGSYHYDPCPWHGEPVPSNIVLHELNSDKSQLHTSRTWSKRIPKKCSASIFSIPDPDEAAIGYGIHIIEGYDTLILAVLMFFGVCIATLATVLWWGKGNPGDIQGATGLGSLILGTAAALAVGYQALPSR